MVDVKKIEKLAQYLHKSVPKLIDDFKCNLDSKIQQILLKHINNLNFVTRDEFDVQTKMLHQIQKNLQQIQIQMEKIKSIYQPDTSNELDHNE